MVLLGNHTCEAINDAELDQEAFWNGRWDAHKVGWVIAGATAAVSTVISLFTVFMHARNYYRPKEQRQIMRILLMPPVYAVISFFSYRYFRSYTYYSLAEVVYESLVLAAFLMLLLQYIGDSTADQKKVLMEKEKRSIPFPFCCIRFRPSKPYFTHALKWSVLQYSLLRPLISLAGVITNALDLYCPTGYSVYFSAVYLDSLDFVSISVALYGLIVFYALVKDRLKGQSPLAKFLGIKGIVMITFYQGFIFGVLSDYGVIKATDYWTATNVADGLQALCTCCEMVGFSALFLWAFSWKSYKEMRPEGAPSTSVFWAVLDSFNYSDFLVEGWRGIVFTIRYILNKPGTHSKHFKNKTSPGLDLDVALGGSGEKGDSPDGSPRPMAQRTMTWGSQGGQAETQIPVAAFGRRSVDSGRGAGENRRSWEAGLAGYGYDDQPYASGTAVGGPTQQRDREERPMEQAYQMDRRESEEGAQREPQHPYARGAGGGGYGQAK
ncbi:organic solute transporter Ostalpha-domain-containing protein [Leucosporidium creatinivorum]|uniref:Organic solute transporter Ostalpha-domain-containing protein n=1 Tax=Leucosporidium creatinivorum TaxID=106004 RepID=A0A1Y2F8W2_9BASI|nr:organic solute transporter Ostalpha-domain-containing protein [Leucosporidium creatinivorum]